MPDSGSVNLGFVVEAVEGDALSFKTDVLAVKYAPRSSGLGALVRKNLKDDIDILPGVDEYRILPGSKTSRAEYVLMVGTGPIITLRYPQLRDLGNRFLEALWEVGLDIEHMATTLHGVRTGCRAGRGRSVPIAAARHGGRLRGRTLSPDAQTDFVCRAGRQPRARDGRRAQAFFAGRAARRNRPRSQAHHQHHRRHGRAGIVRAGISRAGSRRNDAACFRGDAVPRRLRRPVLPGDPARHS